VRSCLVAGCTQNGCPNMCAWMQSIGHPMSDSFNWTALALKTFQVQRWHVTIGCHAACHRLNKFGSAHGGALCSLLHQLHCQWEACQHGLCLMGAS
jgi:hypothetical protein